MADTTFRQSLISGAFAGLAVDLLFFPLDTLKTRLQTKEGFIRSGGFKGVYKGLGSVGVGSAPGAALFFSSYEALKSQAPKWTGGVLSDPVIHMLAASGGEVAACLVRVPTEVVKQRTQTSSYGEQTSSIGALRRVLAEAGLRGLYRGYLSTVAREIPFCCIQFPLYEYLKTLLAKQRSSTGLPDALPAWPDAALCGSAAGSFSAGVTTPLDVAKTRIMLSNKSDVGQGYSKILPTLSRVYSEEGTSALFRGVVPRVLWIGLGGAVFLGTYELFKSALAETPKEIEQAK